MIGNPTVTLIKVEEQFGARKLCRGGMLEPSHTPNYNVVRRKIAVTGSAEAQETKTERQPIMDQFGAMIDD